MFSGKGAIFPPQKLPVSQKNKEWRKRSVDSLIARHKRGDERHQRMKTSYDIINSIFDLQDLKYVIDPFNVKEGFPARIQNINIIRSKIEGLKGEFLKIPRNYHVFQTDERAIESIIDKEKELLMQTFEASLQMTDDQEMSQYLQERLQEIKAYVKNKYYSASEQTAHATIKYLREKLDMDLTFLKTWEDGLVAGESVHYVGILNGDPILERVNPLTFSYDRDPELRFIEDGEWAVREMLMTTTDIHDRFGDIIDEDDFDKLLDRVTQGGIPYINSSNNTGSNINTNYIDYYNKNNINTRDWVEDNRKGAFVSVYHCVWKSFKKIGYLSGIDESGEQFTEIVDETYKVADGETIEWDWITELWEGYRFWNDLYTKIRPVEYQYTSLDDPSAKKLPFVGAAYSTNNTEGKSLVEIMKPLQYFYLILFYRLELALARDAGKPIVMDITQIPKSMGVEPDKWLHYLKSLGVVFVNPYETGWDIPGRDGGKPSAFNQISAIDMTMTNVISEYIGLMDKVEQMLADLTGINDSRAGQVQASELVGNVKQKIIQSSHMTASLFYTHEKVVKNTITMLLNTAKYAWRNSNKKFINYVLSGPERIFLQITDDFLYSDHDIFVSDSSRESQNLEVLRSLYQPAMQNGASLLDIATMMTTENLSEMKMKLQELEDKRMKLQQQMSEMEQAQSEKEMGLRDRELNLKEEDSIRKAETALTIAAMGQGDIEPEEDNSIDMIKIDLQREKQRKEFDLKSKDLQEKIRSNKAKEQISRSKPKTTKK